VVSSDIFSDFMNAASIALIGRIGHIALQSRPK
jgi:hypothetical protein